MILISQKCGSVTADKYILGEFHYKYSNTKNWQKDNFWNLEEREIFMKSNEVDSL